MSASASALDANAGSRAEGAIGEGGAGVGQEVSGDLKGESDIRIGSRGL